MKAAQLRDPNAEALKRIVALLLALAGLARRASARSAPVRLLVHLVVARAETALMAFLWGSAEAPRPGTADLPGPADLLLLAARLAALALLLAKACGTGPCKGGARPVPSGVPARRATFPLRLLLPPFFDTS